MAKNQNHKSQTTVYITQHRKLKTGKHELIYYIFCYKKCQQLVKGHSYKYSIDDFYIFSLDYKGLSGFNLII